MADRTPRGKLVPSSAYNFGRRLKDQRERHGVTLEAIAATIKINVSLLTALERGDVSAWPGGIFRRAFIRGYATAIGLAPEPIVAEFASLFPEQGAVVEAPVVSEATSDLRMTLALDARVTTTAVLTRVAIALFEVCLIVAVALVTASRVQGLDAWRISAVVALIYYPLTRIFPARSSLVAYIQRRLQRVKPAPRRVGAMDVREVFDLVSRGHLRRLVNRQRILPAPDRLFGPPQ